MSIFGLIRAAQSQNLQSSSGVSVVRNCACGAQLAVNASGVGTAGASPTGLFMSADDLRDAWAASARSAQRNARRNSRWARCPRCRRRGRFAVLEAGLTRFVVAIPAALFGAITGCTVGLIREQISASNMGTVAATWGGGFALVALTIAGMRRLRAADQSTELQVIGEPPDAGIAGQP